MNQEKVSEGLKLVITRLFSAPVETVYQAWTEPGRLACWMSPNDRWNHATVDVETFPGGRHNITMNHSNGDTFRTIGKYIEIIPNKRISFTWTWLENLAGLEETLVTVEFRTVAEGTELTLTHERHTDPKALEGTSDGWSGCLEMLERYLNNAPCLGGQ